MRNAATGPTWTALRIGRVSTPALTNRATTMTSLLLIPVSEVLLMVFVAQVVGVMDVQRTAYAAALVGFGLTIVSGVVSQVARDRQTGVLLEVLLRDFFHVRYWFAKAAVPTFLGAPVACTIGLAILTLHGGESSVMFISMLTTMPLVAAVGGLVGVGVAVVGLLWEDPYLLGNVVRGTLPIMAGVVVPVSTYPGWLEAASYGLPLTGAVELLSLEGGVDLFALPTIGREMAIGLAFVAIGWACSRLVVRLMRDGRFREDLF